MLTAAATLAAIGAAAALLILADGARSGEPAQELLPDLVVQPPSELYLKGKKVPRLRVSNIVANKGNGPLEIAPGGAAEACNLKGKPKGRYTLQNVYSDSDDSQSSGYFWRKHDKDFAQTTAGCSRYHKKHDHWHFDNFARYSLYREKKGKQPRYVGGSRKVSFCVLDTGRPYPKLPGSPGSGYYPQDVGAPQFATCSSTSTDGLSIGWEDTYGAALPGQAIRVDGLRRGFYCLVLEVDPPSAKSPGGMLAELDETNNARGISIRMRSRRGYLKQLSDSGCRTFTP